MEKELLIKRIKEVLELLETKDVEVTGYTFSEDEYYQKLNLIIDLNPS